MIHTDKIVNLGESEKPISCDNHHPANQGLSATDSILPPSEPPDIKNWFSSYEYDSLVLETNDNFGFSDYENTEKTVRSSRASDGMKTANVLIKSEEENNQVSESPFLSPVESEPPGIENWFSSYAYESPTPDTMDDLIISDHTVVCNEKLQERKEVVENLASDNLICSEEYDDHGSIKDKKKTTETVNSWGNDYQVSSKRCKSNYLERKGDENGFVSIKSREKSTRGGQTKAPWFVGKMKRGDDKTKRKPLGDVTNIDESCGKWECPRKRKADIRPPLKQLRLGQWFHYS